jgi:hypothetical protein
MINPQITHHQRLRFTNPNVASNSISFANLLDAMLVATTATQGYQIFDQVKVKSIEVWGIVAQGGTIPGSIALTFSGNAVGDAGDGRIISDTSMGIEPAHVFARPAKLSACAMWQSTAAGLNAFAIQAPAGSVMDIEVAYRNTEATPTVVTNALVGAVTGQFYYRGADGLPIASTGWVPIAINTR